MSNKWLVSVLFLLLCYTIFCCCPPYVDALYIASCNTKKVCCSMMIIIMTIVIIMGQVNFPQFKQTVLYAERERAASFRAISMWQESSYYVHSYWPFERKNLSLMSVFSLSFNQLVIQSVSQKIIQKILVLDTGLPFYSSIKIIISCSSMVK